MTDLPLSAMLGALFVLVILSGIFSGSETAMMAANRYRLRYAAQNGHRGAKLALVLLAQTDKLLGLIIRGNANRVVEDLWLPGYYFCYTNNGKALVVAIDAHGRQRNLMKETPVKEIGSGGGYRTVTVEALGNAFYFSVNGTYIWSGKDDMSRFGQVGAGFYVEPGRRGSLALDYANLGPVKATRAS